MILALDPSSTCTGYSVFDNEKLIEAGLIKPNKSGLKPIDRMYQMAQEVSSLVAEYKAKIELVLIELPPPTQGKRRSNPGVQHQAFGMCMYVLMSHGLPRVHQIHPATWTKCRSKEVWAPIIRAKYPRLGYGGTDSGADAAAAVGMTDWWLMIGRYREEQLRFA